VERLDTESGGFTARIFQEMLGVRPPPPWEEPEVRIRLPPAGNPVQTVHSFGLRPLAPSPHSHEWHLASGRRFKSSRGRHFVSLQRLRPGPLCDNVEIPSNAVSAAVILTQVAD
jgi:hypothetical protein